MIDLDLILRFSFALGVVLALIALVAWLGRRHLAAVAPLAAGRRRRLSVIESVALDSRTRLVLVRHDDTEHLIACGPTGTVPVRSGRSAPETPS